MLKHDLKMEGGVCMFCRPVSPLSVTSAGRELLQCGVSLLTSHSVRSEMLLKLEIWNRKTRNDFEGLLLT